MKKKLIWIGLGVLVIAIGFAVFPRVSANFGEERAEQQRQAEVRAGRTNVTVDGVEKELHVATFAGGCFWCVEDKFDGVPGVWAAVSGYSGGEEKNPTYWLVAGGRTGHVEAVQVYYDPRIITYEGLLQAFWRIMDPTDLGGQFSDRGQPYRPAIFYHTDEQKRIAERSKEELEHSKRFPDPVIIPIEPYKNFYLAENFHQNYSRENPLHYVYYTYGSGRGPFVEKIWGSELELDYSKFKPKPDDGEMKTSSASSEPSSSEQ